MLTPDICAARLDVLLDLSRSNGEPVPTAAELARVLSVRTGQIVQVDVVEAALDGRELLDSSLLHAVAAEYHAPTALFTDSKAGAEVEQRMRACLAIRARYSEDGVNVIARGSRFTTRQISEMLTFLQRA